MDIYEKKNSVNTIEKIQPTMMWVTFNVNGCITIVFADSPTNASDKTDITSFYNKLYSFLRYIPDTTFWVEIRMFK